MPARFGLPSEVRTGAGLVCAAAIPTTAPLTIRGRAMREFIPLIPSAGCPAAWPGLSQIPGLLRVAPPARRQVSRILQALRRSGDGVFEGVGCPQFGDGS